MEYLSYAKVNALPDTLHENTVYYLLAGDELQVYLTDKTGTVIKHTPTLSDIQAYVALSVQEIQQNQDIGVLTTQMQQLQQNETALQQSLQTAQSSIDYIGHQAEAASTSADQAVATANAANTAASQAVTTAGQATTVAQATAQAMGTLSQLSTTDKTSLVNSINEIVGVCTQLKSQVGNSEILDTATTGDTTHSWSANQIIAYVQSIQQGILGGADAAYDTLKEIETILQTDGNSITNILTALSGCLQVGQAQTFTTAQMIQGCNNLGIGDPTTDLLAYYQGL